MRTLILVRHAKSDWSDPAVPDRARPLNRRGLRARQALAHFVTGWPVDLVVSSDAVRAVATAEPLAAALGCPMRIEAALYDNGHTGRGLLETVLSLPDEATTVMLVGHNPGLEDLTELLCGSAPAFHTATLARFDVAADQWSAVAAGSATLTDLIHARQLPEADPPA